MRPLQGSANRLEALVGRPVSWLRQVHGRGVVTVTEASCIRGDDGDALVATSSDTALAILTADCAPVALASSEGVLAAVHVGWAGLVAGVVQTAVATMRELGATAIEAALGPCIHPECYEFGDAELDRIAGCLGPTVRAKTVSGVPALDLPAAVAAALAVSRVTLVSDSGVCTACAYDRHFSHRARAEVERQAMIVWKAS